MTIQMKVLTTTRIKMKICQLKPIMRNPQVALLSCCNILWFHVHLRQCHVHGIFGDFWWWSILSIFTSWNPQNFYTIEWWQPQLDRNNLIFRCQGPNVSTKRRHSTSPISPRGLGSKENPFNVGRVGSLFEPILIREYVWAFILQFAYAENSLQEKNKNTMRSSFSHHSGWRSKPSWSSSLHLVEANGLEEEDRHRVLWAVVYVHSSDFVTSDDIQTALGIVTFICLYSCIVDTHLPRSSILLAFVWHSLHHLHYNLAPYTNLTWKAVSLYSAATTQLCWRKTSIMLCPTSERLSILLTRILGNMSGPLLFSEYSETPPLNCAHI